MKNSLIIVAFFTAGILFGIFIPGLRFLNKTDISRYALCGLLFLIGVGIGGDRRTQRAMRSLDLRIVLVPLAVILGTLVGSFGVALFLPGLKLREVLAVGSGFGYYSLSSVIITQIRGPVLGVIGLMANIAREIMTLLTAPLLARYLGNLAPIAAGGATAMDTTLPVIIRFSGKEYAVVAVFSGIVLTLLVPVLVTLLLR
jgi:uncharacterized membrane protein YbjE (DUF340 family)